MKKEKAIAESAPGIYPVQLITVKSIDPSPANKRKDFGNLEELGDSIKAQGLLQPIVIRNRPDGKKGQYELVAGERRWRAFVLKNWDKIPAVIRELTDKEAHDITATENLQREDLSPVEESESIQVLIADGRDPVEIADRIGRPVSWVVRRARIAELSKKWLDAIADPSHPLSKWSASHLELIARYDHARQDDLFNEYEDEWYVLITVKDLEKQLNGAMLAMSAAPWKPADETLLPSAGACTICQKRTSCAPSLFEPIEDTKTSRGDRCLDRECWGKKLIAFHEIRIKKAREEHPGLILLDKGGSPLPEKHPWRDSLSENYKYEGAKKTDPDAVPAYIVGGPGAGRIEYKKLHSWCAQSEKKRPIGEDGKPAPKTMEERRAGLEKRRIIRFINKLMLILRGDDPDTTSAKAGVCRVCGCTEGNCSQCIEKTGSPCHWVNEEKTLCSACADNESKVDPRIEIIENLSHIEIHSLVAAFGAAPARVEFQSRSEDEEDEDFEADFDRWSVYKKTVQMNGGDAIQTAAYCVFDRIIDELRQLTYAPAPDIDFPDNLCIALKLDRESIWNKVVEEIPEPKGWANLKANGTPKAPASKKKKQKAGKKTEKNIPPDPDVAPTEELPATRYKYQKHEIFVSAGLGGKMFGTFRVSNGGSGLKRIVSKKLPMVGDRNEAQRNLDKFAKDNRLTGFLLVNE